MKRRRARRGKTLRPIAGELLDAVGVREPPVPVEEIAQSLGARVRYAPFKGELAGILIRDDERRGVVIGVNSLHHSNRQRFTIAHECGHLTLHRGRSVYVDESFRVNRRDAVSAQATDPEEVEANRFAAELLMPFEMITADLAGFDLDIEDEAELREMAKRYGVSPQALTLRISSIVDELF